MRRVYISALAMLKRRMTATKEMAAKNNMQDCGWTDARNEAYSMAEYYKAAYVYEKIIQRLGGAK